MHKSESSKFNIERLPKKVLISGGKEVGGLQTFAENLKNGFEYLGVSAEVYQPHEFTRLTSTWSDISVLKILSTTALYYTPFMTGSISVIHGFPRPDAQGWVKTIGIFLAYKIAEKNSKVISVSNYVKTHLSAVYNIQALKSIPNPIGPQFLSFNTHKKHRRFITFVGRIHKVKNLDKIIPAMIEFIRQNEEYEIAIVGDGPEKNNLFPHSQAPDKISFFGQLDSSRISEILRETCVFISGCETEAFGISYLEALSQGCSVVMPTSGGGPEIMPNLHGQKIYFFSLNFDKEEIVRSIKYASRCTDNHIDMSEYTPQTIAIKYAEVWNKIVNENNI